MPGGWGLGLAVGAFGDLMREVIPAKLRTYPPDQMTGGVRGHASSLVKYPTGRVSPAARLRGRVTGGFRRAKLRCAVRDGAGGYVAAA